ncbi:TonB-dependent receptor plug domain-containing protein [Sphingobium sp. SYK-6]|uniref:TonB-dependent receptor plug domain-containing protein n=1 Tax=Sphingobium sp. (strain NBRC 103272 / SYK-6) TaxID=627192 RepID=UPI0003052594|nr:TonB-dependent receptor [Sphingobium sp. SYK-6]
MRPFSAFRSLGTTSSIIAMAFCHHAPLMAQQDDAATSSTADNAPSTEAIVVTGSRLARGGFQAPTPVTVLGQEEIARQGSANIGDALNQLPSFRAQSTPATAGVSLANAGAQLSDLRGLGANRTLVLVNGRRFISGTVAGNPLSPAGAVDLNMIPTSLVARTEVVTGGASAAYGSDAVAGVVNLILDDRLEGLRGSAQLGMAERGDNVERFYSLAAGTSFAGGAGHIVLAGEYAGSDGIGSCYDRPFCAAEVAPITNPNPQANGLPRQILLPNARPATASWGGLIVSGPLRGTEFADDGSTFQHDYGTYYGAGLFQSGGSADPRNAYFDNFPLVAPVERYSLYGQLRYDLGSDLEFKMDASYGRVTAELVGAQTRDTNIVIQRDNPFLPEAVVDRMTALGLTSFTFGRIGQDLGPMVGRTTRETARIAAGLEGRIGQGWSWDVYYQYGQTDYAQTASNNRINDNFLRAVDAVEASDGSIVCRSTLTDPTNPLVQGCAPLNLFGQNNFSAAAKAYAYGTAQQNTKLTQHVVAATLRGDLFEGWAGAIPVAIGAEYRVEDAEGSADPVSTALRFYTSPGSGITGPAVEVKEAFAEAALPLARDLPFMQSLELNGAVRVTDYSTSGTVTTWKVGGVWDVSSLLRVRATRSRDIRAPNFFELYSPPSSSFQRIDDPRFGGASELVPVLIGGNEQLRPETADTFTAGVVVSPMRGLRIAADYYDIRLDGAISTLGGGTIVARCEQGAAEFCALIDRDPATQQLLGVRNINLNVNSLKVRGVDFEASYRTRLADGTLDIRLLGTHVIDLITVDSGGTVDRAGMNGAPTSQTSGVPSWTVTGNVGWSKGPFAAQLQGRYVSSGVYNALLIGPGEEGYAPTASNSISDNRIGARVYLNLNSQITVYESGRQKLELFGVANNLLDTMPPNNTPSSSGPGNAVLYDVIGRAYKIGVRFAY